MKGLVSLGILFFAALPSTSTYKLNSFTFGSGGGKTSTATYALEGTAGEQNGAATGAGSFTIKPSFIVTQQANVPQISSFDNGGGVYYNKLHFVIGTNSNPTDALYALSISTDNFVVNNRFVKSDLTVGSSLALSDYQTYAAWGGASGANIVGLTPGTTYYLKVKATQGKYTESAYGPASNVATVNAALTFSVQTSSQSSPPFTINFGTLTAGTVINSPQTVNLSLDTNAVSGANIYVNGKNAGLKSASTAALIAAVTNDLSSIAQGYGAISSSTSQTSGGPLTAVSPYNGASNNVGTVDTTTRSIYTSAGPIVGANAIILLKAKSATNSVASTDYSDVLTLVAAGNF